MSADPLWLPLVPIAIFGLGAIASIADRWLRGLGVHAVALFGRVVAHIVPARALLGVSTFSATLFQVVPFAIYQIRLDPPTWSTK